MFVIQSSPGKKGVDTGRWGRSGTGMRGRTSRAKIREVQKEGCVMEKGAGKEGTHRLSGIIDENLRIVGNVSLLRLCSGVVDALSPIWSCRPCANSSSFAPHRRVEETKSYAPLLVEQ